MNLELDASTVADFARSSRLEWLDANGVGGYASSTVSGAHTRRYHGLLVAATRPPVGRMVLLSKLDETVVLDGARHELGASFFPDVVHPRGFEHLRGFRLDPFPVFEVEVGGVRLRKTVACRHGSNTTLVHYEVLAAPRPFTLVLRPLFAGRDFHSLGHARGVEQEAVFADGVLSYRQADGVPTVYVGAPGARFVPRPDWYYAFELPEERERGFDAREDLFTPGTLELELAEGEQLGVVASIEPPPLPEARSALAAERRRRDQLLARAGHRHPLTRSLVLAADQFVVERGEGLHTLIAGYPWFADWGRDSMISLPGLCLTTGRLEEAKGILRAFAASTSEGMLPNRFPDSGDEPEYNTVDASLWFFQAVRRYLEASGDERTVRNELLPVLREILTWHRRGTRYDIHQDEDGLLYAGVPGVQLTWMDARVGDWVVTPRQGKAVEINALWVNAIDTLAELEERLGEAAAVTSLRAEVRRLRRRFAELFWSDEDGYLLDCVDQRDGEAPRLRDRSLRPNQLLALSLPLALLPAVRGRKVLAAVETHLLTPVGLRTLPPEDPAYRERYQGGPEQRDGAYHQGTVWPWLLGPYLTAVVRLRKERGRRQGRQLVAAFAQHLGAAGLGSISEIFDAEPPHVPRGCFAQAWSVAEVLRAAVEDLGLEAEEGTC